MQQRQLLLSGAQQHVPRQPTGACGPSLQQPALLPHPRQMQDRVVSQNRQGLSRTDSRPTALPGSLTLPAPASSPSKVAHALFSSKQNLSEASFSMPGSWLGNTALERLPEAEPHLSTRPTAEVQTLAPAQACTAEPQPRSAPRAQSPVAALQSAASAAQQAFPSPRAAALSCPAVQPSQAPAARSEAPDSDADSDSEDLCLSEDDAQPSSPVLRATFPLESASAAKLPVQTVPAAPGPHIAQSSGLACSTSLVQVLASHSKDGHVSEAAAYALSSAPDVRSTPEASAPSPACNADVTNLVRGTDNATHRHLPSASSSSFEIAADAADDQVQSAALQGEVRHVQLNATTGTAGLLAHPPLTDDPDVIVISSDEESDSNNVIDVSTDVSSSAASAAEHGSDDEFSQQQDPRGKCQSPGSRLRQLWRPRVQINRRRNEAQSLQTPKQSIADPSATSLGSSKNCCRSQDFNVVDLT